MKINDGKCHHVCVTWESVDGKYAFYKDGKRVMNGNGLAVGFSISKGGALSLGHRTPKQFNNWRAKYTGKMDDLNVWNKVSTPKQILKISKCNGSEAGNVKSWAHFKIKGNRYVRFTKNVCPENC